ncbi:hypothetical protein GGI43DRAFT_210286 [Trichoderma evansii]
MGNSEGLNPKELEESNFRGSRGLNFGDATLECLARAELAVTSAGEGPAVFDNGFGGVCIDGLVPKGLVVEDPAPKDGALGCPGPEDATREAATLLAAALKGSAVDGPPVDGPASKTDAL